MAHEIATINGQAAMAYQGEMPWHQLGTHVDTMDVAAALEAASLNWNVVLRPMYYRAGKNLVKVPARQAVIRDVDGQLLSTVGSDYAPLQNEQAFNVLQPACEQFGVTIESAGALGVGDRVWMLAKLPQTNAPVKGDVVDGYFLVVTGHNGWTSFTARPTPVRVVCSNTLAMAQSSGSDLVRLRHVQSETERIDQVATMVTDIVEQLAATNTLYGKLAAKHMTPDELFAYVSQVLNIENIEEPMPVASRRRDTIINLAKNGKGVEFAPDTAWTAFNAVTEYVDHVRPAEAHNPRTIQQANESALFGANAKLKRRALQLAVAA